MSRIRRCDNPSCDREVVQVDLGTPGNDWLTLTSAMSERVGLRSSGSDFCSDRCLIEVTLSSYIEDDERIDQVLAWVDGALPVAADLGGSGAGR